MWGFPSYEGHFGACHVRHGDCPCQEKAYFRLMGAAVLILLNEIVMGIFSGSHALLSDTPHIFSDAILYATAYLGTKWSRHSDKEKSLLETTGQFVQWLNIVAGVAIITLGFFQISFWRDETDFNALEMLIGGTVGGGVNLWMYLLLRKVRGLHSKNFHFHAQKRKIHLNAVFHTVCDLLGSVGVAMVALGMLAGIFPVIADRILMILIGIVLLAQVFWFHQHEGHGH